MVHLGLDNLAKKKQHTKETTHEFKVRKIIYLKRVSSFDFDDPQD